MVFVQSHYAALSASSVGDLYLLVLGNLGEGRYGDGFLSLSPYLNELFIQQKSKKSLSAFL